MSTFPMETDFEQIDEQIRALAATDLNTMLPAQIAGSIDQLVAVYRAVRPLIVIFGGLPLLPPAWRAALTLFTQSLDAVAASVTASKDFKAGKDL